MCSYINTMELFLTNNEKHDCHSNADDDDPRFHILEPRSPLRSFRGFSKLVSSHI